MYFLCGIMTLEGRKRSFSPSSTREDRCVRYDEERISWIVADKRRSFKIRFYIIAALMLGALTVSIINVSDYLSVLLAMIEFPLMLIMVRLIKKHDARVLLSKEIKGKSIKEYEYAISGRPRTMVFRRANVAHTFANRASSPMRLNGTVYLELEDGNVTSISGLYKSHMDIYEDGDMLIKYAGTKFPIIVGREVKKQPCPICGEINDSSRDACKACGLGIVKNRK